MNDRSHCIPDSEVTSSMMLSRSWRFWSVSSLAAPGAGNLNRSCLRPRLSFSLWTELLSSNRDSSIVFRLLYLFL